MLDWWRNGLTPPRSFPTQVCVKIRSGFRKYKTSKGKSGTLVSDYLPSKWWACILPFPNFGIHWSIVLSEYHSKETPYNYARIRKQRETLYITLSVVRIIFFSFHFREDKVSPSEEGGESRCNLGEKKSFPFRLLLVHLFPHFPTFFAIILLLFFFSSWRTENRNSSTPPLSTAGLRKNILFFCFSRFCQKSLASFLYSKIFG